ncbi:ribonuclease VapC [Methylopila jiangsuensis]|uniref:Ribonuclease VapC n=1 Tax=Methylopila jiangsuensis TaxID=586230 RepID=A0A9W6N2D2_9HYPH|nr:type II toxin-antitoxin system VapC family toxin [Methylopila jiangsuensis]MDR6285402.1 ribonuclease VapC [Methylopila jiangsuensis]GLK75160.1 ribonuclease VapC [Methylopila jiangsuensis]
MSDAVFVDASALTAILLQEPEADDLSSRLVDGAPRLTSAIALYETALAVASRKRITVVESRRETLELLKQVAIDVVDVTADVGGLAIDAHLRYGKGAGHPAQLNMGDCFAYACATAHGARLLYKGEDFARTDLA